MKHPQLLKVSIALTMLCALINTAFCQSAQTEVEIIQEVFGLEKRLVVANFMDIKEADKGFWTIYDAYELERKALGRERLEVIAEYAKNYPNISDEEILSLLKRTTKIKKAFNKLQKTYFKRMKKELGVRKAAQFWQLENYFNSMIQAEIYSQIPFIGENIEGF